jgi:hypothetical protein
MLYCTATVLRRLHMNNYSGRNLSIKRSLTPEYDATTHSLGDSVLVKRLGVFHYLCIKSTVMLKDTYDESLCCRGRWGRGSQKVIERLILNRFTCPRPN